MKLEERTGHAAGEPVVHDRARGGLWTRFRYSPVGVSVFRSPSRATPRDRAAGHWSNFFLHIYPVKMRREQTSFRYSWYLGVISLVLLGSLVASGIYLMFFYVPSPNQAYVNIQTLQVDVRFGQYIRNVHRWSAHLMVLAVAAHMARVFYRGAHKKPREFNWIIGVVLLVLTLLMSFTGYLLPWDQLAFWAVTVGTEMAGYVPFIGDSVSEMLLGGSVVGAPTLLRFYVLHVVVLPLAMLVVLMVHLWRWRKDSMLDGDDTGEGTETTSAMSPSAMSAHRPDARPVSTNGHRRVLGVVPGKPVAGDRKEPDRQDLVMVWPHLLVRHAVTAMALLVLVLLVSVFFDAPLRAVANPTLTPNPEKAPWYFAALQELLSHFHPLIAGVLIPAGIIVSLIVMPYIDNHPTRKPGDRKVSVLTFTLVMVLWIILTLIGFAFRGPNWDWVWPWIEWHGEL